ncbi:hypothetical protein RUM44_009265 [Polyplax serrata]|uniref:DNA primase large subunit C-terminal domain-containing protein n=1 Tax=Polyplax serrata TaxID=468196 RepID=A0ABR1AS69_POLSC
MDLDLVESILLKRSQRYQSIVSSQIETEELKCYDKVSHLLMCFIACDYPSFVDTYLQGELKMFLNKLNTISYSDILQELTVMLLKVKYMAQCEEVKAFYEKELQMLNLVLDTTSNLVLNGLHIFGDSHSEQCEELTMTLPFTFLPELVGKRKVEVNLGRVRFTCGQWRIIAEVAYSHFLELELHLLKRSKNIRQVIYSLEDDRLRQVIKRFTNVLKGRRYIGGMVPLKAEDIDSASRCFPPCMANLHQVLRRAHRLSYESRYKYQIEHIYGLIGNREPKTCHSCPKFIDESQSKTDGGCPFQHCSQDDLMKAIPRGMLAMPDIEDMLQYKSSGMPQRACLAYLLCQKKMLLSKHSSLSVKPISNSLAYVISPLQYYNIAKRGDAE